MQIEEHKHTILFYILGGVILITSFFLDHALVDIMGEIENAAVTYVIEWTSYALIFAFVLLILTSLFMWEDKKRDWIIPTWFTFLTALLVTFILKIIVVRERPEEIIGLIHQYSFPCSIMAICFSTAALIDHLYPSLKWLWIIFASVVALSSLYLQLSFLSDIIAGALIGYSLGLGMLHIKKKYNLFGASI